MISLLGQFKSETSLRLHCIPMANRSNSGLEYRKWVERVVEAREQEGRTSGPMFCDSRGKVASYRLYERAFYQLLRGIQQDREDLIPADVDLDLF